MYCQTYSHAGDYDCVVSSIVMQCTTVLLALVMQETRTVLLAL